MALWVMRQNSCSAAVTVDAAKTQGDIFFRARGERGEREGGNSGYDEFFYIMFHLMKVKTF